MSWYSDESSELIELFNCINWPMSQKSKTVGMLFPGFILSYNMTTAIEIGIWNAFMTEVIGYSLELSCGKQGLLLSCDNRQLPCNRAEKKGKPIQIAHKVLCEDSQFVDWEKHLDGRKADIVFIDGNHSYETVSNDLKGCAPCVKSGGFIFMHDYFTQGVKQAVDKFLKIHKWPMMILPANRISGDTRSVFIQKP